MGSLEDPNAREIEVPVHEISEKNKELGYVTFVPHLGEGHIAERFWELISKVID